MQSEPPTRDEILEAVIRAIEARKFRDRLRVAAVSDSDAAVMFEEASDSLIIELSQLVGMLLSDETRKRWWREVQRENSTTKPRPTKKNQKLEHWVNSGKNARLKPARIVDEFQFMTASEIKKLLKTLGLPKLPSARTVGRYKVGT